MTTSALRDHLQSRLPGSYTVEREPGGSGMSRVCTHGFSSTRRRVTVRLSTLLSLWLAQGCGGSDAPATSTDPSVPGTPVPANLVAVSATSLSGEPGQTVAAPSVRVTSASGTAIPGVTVTFTVATGGGSVSGATQVTDQTGIATAGGWVLGALPGSNTLTASVSGLPAVTFTASAAFSLSVTPNVAATVTGGTTAFNSNPAAVSWRVNGLVGGSPSLGTISPEGIYTAPTTIPSGDSVIVSAVLASDTSVHRASPVFFVPSFGADYILTIPRVVDAQRPHDTRVLLVPPLGVATVTFQPTIGPSVPFTPIGNGVHLFTLDHARALAGYVTGTLHNFVGFLDYRTAGGQQVKLTNFGTNVRDPTMPNVAVTSLGLDAQRSAYVLNIRLATVTVYPNAPIVSRALQLLGGDQFDFVAVIATVHTNNNRVHIGVRNDVLGIGRQVYNSSSAWGGTGRLRGVLAYPIDAFFDAAEGGTLHEIGHSWINFATAPELAGGVPHWPASSMANGLMGMSIGGSNVGGEFPWTLTPLQGGDVRVNRAPPLDSFSPLDLYLMGLLAPDSVPPVHLIAPSVNVTTLVDGALVPAMTYTIAQYIAAHGARSPASGVSPRQFSAATVVLSVGRLLTPVEMAFFDHASARGETTVPLDTFVGRVRRLAPGFYTATGRRATLRTRLPF